MLKKIFILCFFIIGCSHLFGVTFNNRIFTYIKNNAVICFDSKLPDRKQMLRELTSSNVKDLINCVTICETMIRQSLFESRHNFEKVISLISDSNIPSALGMSKVERVFIEMSEYDGIEKDYNRIDLSDRFVQVGFICPDCISKIIAF